MVATATGYSPGVPGFTDIRETVENQVTFQTFFQGDVIYDAFPILASTAVDAGNTPTTALRPGLLVAKLDTDGSYVAYDPDANDGSQEAVGVLIKEINMLDYTTAAAAARVGDAIVIQGKLKASAVLNLDMQARRQLAARGFTFDDAVWTPPASFRRVHRLTAAEITADAKTLTAADSGKLFITTGGDGAFTFTLPTIAAGLVYEFLNYVAQDMVITSAEGNNIVATNDIAASSITLGTSNEEIAARLRVEAVYVDATVLKWICTPAKAATQTIA